MQSLSASSDTQRLIDVSPRSAFETIIRHFTDSVDQKRERKDLADTLRQQVARAQEQAINARQYSAAVDKILGDHCQAARVAFTRANPSLNQQQIAEVREFTQKLPSLNPSRIELNDWARGKVNSYSKQEKPPRLPVKLSKPAVTSKRLDPETNHLHRNRQESIGPIVTVTRAVGRHSEN